MLIRAGAGTSASSRSPATPSPRFPARAPEDQRGLRVRRGQARDRDDRELPRDQHRPGRDRRLPGLPRPDRLGRRDQRDREQEDLLRGLGRRRERRLQPLPRSGPAPLTADQALTLARTRENVAADPKGKPARRYPTSTAPSSSRTSSTGSRTGSPASPRIPYNFLHGPFIGWSAPKAFVSSMGVLTLPQFVLSSAIGGGDADVLETRTTRSTR